MPDGSTKRRFACISRSETGTPPSRHCAKPMNLPKKPIREWRLHSRLAICIGWQMATPNGRSNGSKRLMPSTKTTSPRSTWHFGLTPKWAVSRAMPKPNNMPRNSLGYSEPPTNAPSYMRSPRAYKQRWENIRKLTRTFDWHSNPTNKTHISFYDMPFYRKNMQSSPRRRCPMPSPHKSSKPPSYAPLSFDAPPSSTGSSGNTSAKATTTPKPIN